MAAVDGNRITFYTPEGKKTSLGCAKLTKKQKVILASLLDTLIESAKTGLRDLSAERRATELGDTWVRKFIKLGLLPQNMLRTKTTLKEAVDQYMRKQEGNRPSSIRAAKFRSGFLIQFFGEDKDIATITEQDAHEFMRWMHQRTTIYNKPMSKFSVYSYCKAWRAVFNLAMRYKQIDSNPFIHCKAGAFPNPARFFYVPEEYTPLILAACPNTFWKLVWVFCRYAGIRTVSEFVVIKWSHIDFENSIIWVDDIKRSCLRKTPMFPELRSILELAYQEKSDEDEYLWSTYKRTECHAFNPEAWHPNYTVRCIVKKAGIVPWVKLLQNCRSSRETELCRKYPIQAVTAWLGNTPNVAIKHYLQVLDDDFKKAVNGEAVLDVSAVVRPSNS